MTNFSFKTKGNRVHLAVDFELTENMLAKAIQNLDLQIDPDPRGESIVEALTAANALTRFILTRTIAEFTGKSFKQVDDRCGKPLVDLNKSIVTK